MRLAVSLDCHGREGAGRAAGGSLLDRCNDGVGERCRRSGQGEGGLHGVWWWISSRTGDENGRDPVGSRRQVVFVACARRWSGQKKRGRRTSRNEGETVR